MGRQHARPEDPPAALELFQAANPGITVRTEYQDSAPYKDKLATRFAAGDPPDLMAMRMDSSGSTRIAARCWSSTASI